MAASPPPPSYPHSISKTRSQTSPDEVKSLARSMLRASLDGDGPVTPRTPTSHISQSSHTAYSSRTGSTITPSPNSRLTSPVTSTRTRDRLREIERERDDLLGAVAKERAIADRLKKEGRTTELSTADIAYRHRALKHDMRVASREILTPSATGLFKNVCSTDLLFLIDTTSSMQSHIDAAKAQVRNIVDSVDAAFLGKAEVRMAIVGYKDHSDSPNIQFLDFTPSIDRVHAFLNQLKASGGADIPEDVLGGLRQALNATWSHQTRCIIHIADAPPHGGSLQNSPITGDSYPYPGSEPHGLTHEPLLAQMIALHINYALLRINGSTDCMAYTFSQAYSAASGECKLHASNKYAGYYTRSTTASSAAIGYSKRAVAQGGLLFEEAELGTAFSALQHLVVKIVTASASRTAMRASKALRTGKAKTAAFMSAIGEDEEVEDVPVENVPPQWNKVGWLNETLKVEGFSPDIGVHSASTLSDMMASDDNIKMSLTQLTIHKRSRPFAQGAMRTASYACTANSTNPFVVKAFKKSGKRLAHVAEDMMGQVLCKAFALEFNALTGESNQIDFIVTTCLKGKGAAGIIADDECMSLEPYIPGDYVKYNNNCGWVNEDGHGQFNKLAQAFSHFSFERSRGKFMVTDLQGVGHTLTDPCLHTKDTNRFKLSDTNLGEEGFMFFFATHKCNNICTKLGLKSTGSMFTNNIWQFREIWPKLDSTVCCSNKLCGKIVKIGSAKKADQFPGFMWCNGCWPQLKSSEVKRVCVADGEHHDFKASAFFFESQGRGVPRKCPEHRGSSEPRVEVGGGETVSKDAMLHKGFWNKLKFAKRKSGSEVGVS